MPTEPLHAEPSDAQLAAIAAHRPDGPIVALNLNRYRERAAYPAGTPDADVSGRVAYARYGVVAVQAIEHAALLLCDGAPEPVLTSPFGA